MRHLIIGVVAGMFPLYSAFADIPSDIASGLSISEVVSNATADGQSVESIFQQVAAINPDTVALVVSAMVSANPDAADSIVAAAITAAPDKAQDITSAAISSGADADAVITAAIGAGADPTSITEATAAGNPQGQGRGLGIAPGQTGRAVTPPPFGSNAGGGGGGIGSPS
ncbi:hypothetical protein [Neptunomonas concharum]|uniref:Uncharacterized protein n=1 Tax=Neptunomonas concharum TaxID=1031538 RepID=A0A5P1R8M5_9GAMM|nr:hypothetical protein [Neptunomonas concharum]QEQ95984.1 hypothetical protein F0U83_04275 [Neptunomonas concharum]